MINKLLASVAVGVLVSFSATADSADRSNTQGEALAWTVAAYASCETRDELQSDFQSEVTNLQADTVDILAALRILADADNVCGQVNSFAVDMLALAETDMPTLEARLGAARQVSAPVFELEEPEGAGGQNSIILAAASDAPPQSSPNPASSDYQE